MSSPPPAAAGAHQANNFDAIRISAALAVLVSHHYALTAQAEPSFLGLHTWGGMAVIVFFVISGYLVTSSWYNDPSFLRFSQRRILRIWPALAVVVVLTAYGLGALVTSLPLMEYWTHRATLDYLLTLKMNVHFMLPGVFTNNPYAHGVNGSLWTIPLEVRCYVVMAIAGLLGLMKFRSVWMLLIAAYMAWFLTKGTADVTGQLNHGRDLSAFFLAGSALYLLQPQWKRHPFAWILMALVGAAVLWACGWHHTALLLLLPITVLHIGTSATPVLRRFGRWGDPSYGIYLFAFPVQQTVILYTWPDLGFAGTLILALLITVGLAYASWHLIEKQALKFKPSRKGSKSQALSLVVQSARSVYERAQWFWPLLACITGLYFIFKRLNAPVLIDPANTYLPAARAFLEQGWAFLLTPQSYHVTPLAYLWLALWGADPTWIRIANMGLWVGCVWFLWRTCCMLGGVRAGAVGMLLMLSPELVRYFPSEMTEPVYLFGIFGWMYAMARIIIDQERSVSVVALGALMLTITLLSRPVLQLIAPAALLVCVGYIAYGMISGSEVSRSNWRLRAPVIAWSIGMALILPIALIVKNGIVFGLWGMGTGSGTGLYLGTHPLYQGAEPGFLGFIYDINAMIGLAGHAGSHLTMDGDRAARAAAVWQLQQMSIADGTMFFLRKLWWWLAHHPAQIEAFGGFLRKVRFFELLVVLASIGWFVYGWLRKTGSHNQRAVPRTQFAGCLLVMFLLMLCQLLPILHNSRYSSVLLDPWLIALTAFGIAHLTATIHWEGAIHRDRWAIGLTSREGASLWPPIGTLALIVLITFAGYNAVKKRETISVDPKHMGQTLTRLHIQDSRRIETFGMQPQSNHEWVIQESPAALHVRIEREDVQTISSAQPINALWHTDIALRSNSHRCRKAEVAYFTADGRILQPSQRLPLQHPIQADGSIHSLITHANHELRPNEPGSLRIVLHCPIGTSVDWRGTRLLESRHAWDASSHIQH